MSEDDIPLCKDCRHFWRGTQTCGRPVGEIFDAVYGRQTVKLSRSAKFERKRNRGLLTGIQCGPLGRFFHHAGAKAPLPPADDD